MKEGARRVDTRYFKDERGNIVSLWGLWMDYQSGISEAGNFDEYLRNCLSGNGTLEEISKNIRRIKQVKKQVTSEISIYIHDLKDEVREEVENLIGPNNYDVHPICVIYAETEEE